MTLVFLSLSEAFDRLSASPALRASSALSPPPQYSSSHPQNARLSMLLDALVMVMVSYAMVIVGVLDRQGK